MSLVRIQVVPLQTSGLQTVRLFRIQPLLLMTSPEFDPHMLRVLDWIDRTRPTRIAVVMDPNTERHCLPLITPLLPPHTDFLCLSQDGESIKGIEHAHALWSSLEEVGYDRSSALIGLGGGTVTDLTGFVASTYLRGLDFWLVPTTLLAMVDAASGGKSGINLMGAKNRIGTFARPSGVSLCPAFLSTLPPRQLKSGLAEHIKHLLLTLSPEDVSHRMSQLNMDDTPVDSDAFASLIMESIAIKENIVSQDPKEVTGVRKMLNFGHTFGHALESWAMAEGLDLLHGEAVAWGLGAELTLSAGRFKKGSTDALNLLALRDQLNQKFHCPVTPPEPSELWTWALKDKKNAGNAVHMVLLSETGAPLVDQAVTQNEFANACSANTPPSSNPA